MNDQKGKLPLHGFTSDQTDVPGISYLSDAKLEEINELLPWSAFVSDSMGRRFGNQASDNKHN